MRSIRHVCKVASFAIQQPDLGVDRNSTAGLQSTRLIDEAGTRNALTAWIFYYSSRQCAVQRSGGNLSITIPMPQQHASAAVSVSEKGSGILGTSSSSLYIFKSISMLRCVDIPTVKARTFHGWILLLCKRAGRIAKVSTLQGAVAAPVYSPDERLLSS